MQPLRDLTSIAALALCLLAPAAAAAQPRAAADLLETTGAPGRPGGRLVMALRAEPKTFNPAAAFETVSLAVIRRLTADLIHVDRETQLPGAALAKSWTVAPDGRRFRVELRRGLKFSDGEPLDAADVVFSFTVYLDEKVAAPQRPFLIVGGEPITVSKLGPHTLEFTLSQPYAVGERIFDNVAILPRHRLEAAYREGSLPRAWGLDTPPSEIAGLGPFRLKRFVPGQRLELERNPHYWKVDREGRRLPYLDEIVFLFVASQDAQVIRFKAGETHLLNRLDAASFNLLRQESRERDYVMKDLGPGLQYQFLFFNLNDLDGRDLPEIERKQLWFRQLAFRQAVSSAIDRAGIARLVYNGRATGVASHVTPGSKLWLNRSLAPPPRSLEAARRLLRSAGFSWDGDGRLIDGSGSPVEFSIVTNSSNSERVQMATIIQDDLSQLGVTVRVAALEFRAFIDRVMSSHDYEAALLGLSGGDGDPNSSINVLTSGGSHHLWRLSAGAAPAPWQAEVDRLMGRQPTVLDPAERKRLYDRVQELVADNVPFIPLVSPNVLVGAARDLGNFRPAVLDHFTLWNSEELFWRADP